jgi:hypothetical protein
MKTIALTQLFRVTINPYTCPCCYHQAHIAVTASGDNEPGEPGVCTTCAGILILNQNRRWTEMPNEDFQRLEEETVVDITEIQKEIINLRKKQSDGTGTQN